ARAQRLFAAVVDVAALADGVAVEPRLLRRNVELATAVRAVRLVVDVARLRHGAGAVVRLLGAPGEPASLHSAGRGVGLRCDLERARRLRGAVRADGLH